MKKKSVLMFLAICLLLSVLPMQAVAAGEWNHSPDGSLSIRIISPTDNQTFSGSMLVEVDCKGTKGHAILLTLDVEDAAGEYFKGYNFVAGKKLTIDLSGYTAGSYKLIAITEQEGVPENAARASVWFKVGSGGTTSTAKWEESAKGWRYSVNGSYAASKWLIIGGKWYYFGADGYMKTGWQTIGGAWYYLQSSGAMKTGWLLDGKTWYYLQSSGAMKMGWVKEGSTWYYMQASGAMKTGWLNHGGTWYYLKASGAMAAGEWLKQDGKWYYLKGSGAMASNETLAIRGTAYKFNSSGVWIG